MDPVAETENVIREKLESNGQLQKFRAMVVDASLKALTNDGKDADSLFTFSKSLLGAKKEATGLQALSLVKSYLEFLGLNYTANVLGLEAGLKDQFLKDEELRETFHLPAGVTPLVGLLSQNKLISMSQPATAPASAPTPTPVAPAQAPAVAQAIKSTPVVKSKSIETLYEIAEWEGREFTRFNKVAGQQVQLYNLLDCKVFVYDPLDSMTVDDCTGGEVVLAACEGSLFLRNCKNMTVYAAVKQLRLRDCEHLNIHLFSTTDPVVEMSHHITLKPFNLRLPKMIESFKAARLDAAVNRFIHVYDFTVDDPKLPQPHFTVAYPDHGLVMQNVGMDVGAPECPKEIEDLLEGRLEPASSSESGQNKSHNIKSGSNAWQKPAAATPSVAAPKVEVKPMEIKPVSIKPADAKPTNPIPVPAVPVVPTPVIAAAPLATAAVDDDHYSSYSDSSNDNDDDKYEVDEDDDDF